MTYTLKDGTTVESIPIGRTSVRIGEQSPLGFLTVCDRVENLNKGSKHTKIVCKCICGEYIVTSLNSFRTSHIISCGCQTKQAQQERGQNVGKNSQLRLKDYSKIENPFYTFNFRLDKKTSCGYFWDVSCKKCGQHYEVIPSQIISQTRRKGNNPCKCWQFTSKGILKIQDILIDNNIPFILEKQFENCISPKGYPFKFDFWVNNSYLIEYDGEQHFLPSSFGGQTSGIDRLKEQQYYDTLKNQWCKENNIPLIRISYTQYNKLTINDLQLSTSKFIV